MSLDLSNQIPSGWSNRQFKARLVAKGYTQQPGIEYTDTFSPTAKVVSIRCLLSLASIHGWTLTQLDVANTFLQGHLDEEIFMTLPLSYKVDGSNKVCKMRKSLYGLKQASRKWNHKFTLVMTAAGFTQSQHDHSLFFKHNSSCGTLLLVYVDDIIITGNDIGELMAYTPNCKFEILVLRNIF